jgi:hypothetical protein
MFSFLIPRHLPEGRSNTNKKKVLLKSVAGVGGKARALIFQLYQV